LLDRPKPKRAVVPEKEEEEEEEEEEEACTLKYTIVLIMS
jgi:hypothetical protein